MRRQRLLCSKTALFILLLAMAYTPAIAGTGTTYKKSSGVQHYITIGVSGGEGNTLMHSVDEQPSVHNRIGVDGQAHVGYELRQRSFFFGLGVGIDYDLGRQYVDSLKEFYIRSDRENDPIIYTYAYRNYSDMQQAARISIPIYLGGYLTEEVYLLAGAKLGIGVWGTHAAETDLETYGTYIEFIHTIHHAPYYGYYPEGHYTYADVCPAASFTITPMVEVGYKIPVQTPSKRVEMRLGGYVEYGIPLAMTHTLPMVDISHTDINPQTQNIDNLRANIILNAPTTTTWQKNGRTNNLQVGVRFTCLFNVTPRKRFCMCTPERSLFR